MPGTTRELARFLTGTTYADLPEGVRLEGPRAFLNWLGCVYGGLHDPTCDTAYGALAGYAGPGEAIIIGRERRADPISAVFFNTLSSCTHSFDDAHLATVAHPSGPAAAAALTPGQLRDVSGREMLTALLLGIEVQCRMAHALTKSPDSVSIGFNMTGLTGALGSAAAAGKLFGLDEQRMCWALGIAAAQGAGFRETHTTMSNGLMRAQAARNGMTAAILAQGGFTCAEAAIEGSKGFLAVFGCSRNAGVVTEDLGTRYHLLENAYKPYPCGIPIHPIIDVCLEIAGQTRFSSIESVELSVHPWAMLLTGRQDPSDVEEARISLFHWAAAAIARGRAGLAEGEEACIKDPTVAQLRGRISAKVDQTLSPDSARGVARLEGGTEIKVYVEHARGSAHRPLSNPELEEKLRGQAAELLESARIADLIGECWALASDRPLLERRLLDLIS